MTKESTKDFLRHLNWEFWFAIIFGITSTTSQFYNVKDTLTAQINEISRHQIEQDLKLNSMSKQVADMYQMLILKDDHDSRRLTVSRSNDE